MPGRDTLGLLLDGWFGPAPSTPLRAAPVDHVPGALVRAHEALARHPGAFVQNDLTPLDELRADDGFVAVVTENQGNCIWSYAVDDAELDDPPIWADWGGPDVRLAGITLEPFLVAAYLIELTLTARFVASGEPDGEDQTVALAPLQSIPIGPIEFPEGVDTSFLAGPGLISVVSNDHGDRAPWTYIAAVDEEAFGYLRPLTTPADSDDWRAFADWPPQ